MKGTVKMSDDKQPQEVRPQGITLPPEIAAEAKARMEMQARQRSVKDQIDAILEAGRCTIQVSVSLHSDMPFQAVWRVVAIPKEQV